MIPQLVEGMGAAKEARSEAAASTTMVYSCECGRRWKMAGKSRGVDAGEVSWDCDCGRGLSMRNGVIFAPAPGRDAGGGVN